MSIDLDWSNLRSDNALNDQIKAFLNDQIAALPLPDYLNNLTITKFQLGEIPPNLTIRHIGNPFSEFYEEDEASTDKDIQFLVEFEYKGDLSIELQVDLLLNYPSPGFIKLPVKLNIVEIGIHSLAIVSYIQSKCFFSFLCDLNDDEFDNLLKNPQSITSHNNNRIDIIRSLKIESEIGETDQNVSGNILRNVGKVEKFLTDLIRNLLRDELAWPGWICLDFGDSSDDVD